MRKVTGSDGIPARLLKLTGPVITKSLTHLFNCNLEMGGGGGGGGGIT